VTAEGGLNEKTFYEYIDALERLHIIRDIDAWNPAIRSKTAIRSGTKKNLIDPSLAVAGLCIAGILRYGLQHTGIPVRIVGNEGSAGLFISI